MNTPNYSPPRNSGILANHSAPLVFDWRDAAALAASAAAMFAGLGSHGLYEPHEGHYAELAREMLLSRDWLVPHMNGSPYLNKPPMMYWSIALAFKVAGGFGELAARAPGAFYGWIGAIGAWAWARCHLDFRGFAGDGNERRDRILSRRGYFGGASHCSCDG